MAIGATSSSFKDFVNIIILKIITSRGSKYDWGTKKRTVFFIFSGPLHLKHVVI